MPGRYGTASAGARTIGDPCALPLCSGSDGVAWWQASKIWRSFLLGLIISAKNKIPQSDWPPGLQAGLPAAETAASIFADDSEYPWVLFGSEIEAWAAAQQTMRDFAGELADFLESKGIKVGGKPPADAPPAASLGTNIENLVKLAGLAVGAYVLVNLLKATKD
jgi:hypothetical protein